MLLVASPVDALEKPADVLQLQSRVDGLRVADGRIELGTLLDGPVQLAGAAGSETKCVVEPGSDRFPGVARPCALVVDERLDHDAATGAPDRHCERDDHRRARTLQNESHESRLIQRSNA